MPVKMTKARMKLATGPASTIAARFRNGCPAKRQRAVDRRIEPRPVPDAGGVGVAVKLDISAERQRADPPARAARIHPREQLRTEAERESVDFNAAPSADQIVPKLVDRDDKAQDHDERDDVPSEPRQKAGDRIHSRHPRPPIQPPRPTAVGGWLLKQLQWRKSTLTPIDSPPYLSRYGELSTLPQCQPALSVPRRRS